MVLGELLPFLGLGSQYEVQDIGRQEAKRPVVVLRPAFVIATGPQSRVAVGLLVLADAAWNVRDLIGPVAQQGRLDGRFEGALGNHVFLLHASAGVLKGLTMVNGCSSHTDSSRGTFSRKRHHVVRDRNVLTIGIGQRRPRLVEA